MSAVTSKDLFYLSKALELAALGKFTTKPNPSVGCLLVKNNKIIGQGYHKEAGFPHAEIEALNNCTEAPKDSTCYVTLEPCFHYGRTPPCVDALINAQVSRVVILSLDSNPKVSGQSIKKLQDNNITVDVLADSDLTIKAKELNKGFFKRITQEFPYVISKIAISMDGCIALKNGDSKWITGNKSREDVHKLRAEMSAIITTSTTVINDNAKLNPRLNNKLNSGINLDSKYWPIRVVLDENLKTEITHDIYKLPGKVIVCTISNNHKKIKEFQANGISIIFETNIKNILKLLATEYECNQVLFEVGAGLNAVLLQEKLIDELVLYKSAKILGKDSISMFDIANIKDLDNNLNYFKLIDAEVIENDVKLIYKK